MKNKLTIIYLFTYIIIAPVFANSANVLKNRLNQVNSFYASFTQNIMCVENSIVLQDSEGELWVKRPNLFNWHSVSPDESILISDGKTLWFYNPFIEQVTATWLKNTIDNMPFMLIISNNSTDWCKYNVSQQGDNFILMPKANNSNLKQFSIKVTSNGIIEGFTFMEQNGYYNVYNLKNQKNGPVDAAKFYFTLPKGVKLDDQRQ